MAEIEGFSRKKQITKEDILETENSLINEFGLWEPGTDENAEKALGYISGINDMALKLIERMGF